MYTKRTLLPIDFDYFGQSGERFAIGELDCIPSGLLCSNLGRAVASVFRRMAAAIESRAADFADAQVPETGELQGLGDRAPRGGGVMDAGV
jgi:hypothetical protein